MIIEWRAGRISVSLPDDFKRFNIAVAATAAPAELLAQVAADFQGLAAFSDERQAWVSPAGLRQACGRGDDAEWAAGLEAMVEKARPHGWIDAATGAIRAHVEWLTEPRRAPDGRSRDFP